MTGVAAAAICLGLASCSRYDFTPISEGEQAYVNYEKAFTEKFGEPAPDQTWGFGSSTTKATRSITSPAVASASQPYDAAWVDNYLASATEVNSTNAVDNYDNGYNAQCQWYATGGGKLATLIYNYTYCVYEGGPVSQQDKDWYTENILPIISKYLPNCNWNDNSEDAHTILMKLKEYTGDYNYWNLNVNSEGGWVADPNYVRNFKITGTWDGSISVVASEGYIDNVKSNAERTVVVTGKWNLTKDQKVGSLGRIIVANGGEIVVSSGKTLSSVNEAQIVVLPGGKITGDGTVAFHNGTSSDLVSYNGGTIDVGTFNNNGGDFYNYGTLKATTLLGGAGLSCYYNHGIMNIQNTGGNNSSSANTRVFNACQFYCSGDMRIRNYEGTQGSSLICAGELMLSGSADGTSDASYVGLEGGALVQCGTLYNNGTSWSGPTENEYAVLDIIKTITYINWEQDAPQNGGYFANNIYVCAGDWTNTPGGNGWSTWTAKKKFDVVRNATGNGNVKYAQKTNDSNDELIPTDDFQAGVKGCTPGFRGKPEPEAIRIIAEDLSATEGSDFDFNDVVFDVKMNWPSEGKHTITLLAAGGTLPLTIAGEEVHAKFGVPTNKMVNTESWTEQKAPVTFIIEGNYTNANEIEVRVQKGSDWPLLTAPTGKAASKIAVSTDYKWVKELQDITNAYSDFDTYVTTGNPAKWWESNKNDTYIYNAQ